MREQYNVDLKNIGLHNLVTSSSFRQGKKYPNVSVLDLTHRPTEILSQLHKLYNRGYIVKDHTPNLENDLQDLGFKRPREKTNRRHLQRTANRYPCPLPLTRPLYGWTPSAGAPSFVISTMQRQRPAPSFSQIVR